MCGEIHAWQIARQVFIRLQNSGARQTFSLGNTYHRVEEIWLDETFITDFNAGVSAAYYLDLSVSGMAPGTTNNEARPGVLMMLDCLNPHTVFSRPRVIARGSMVTVNSINIDLSLATTSLPPTFDEAVYCVTLICRRSPEEMEEYRALKAAADYDPNIRDAMVQNTFQPGMRR